MVQRKNLASKVMAVALALAPWLGCGTHHNFEPSEADAGHNAGGADSIPAAGGGDAAGGAAPNEQECALTLCAGVCTDTAKDVEHCGACDKSCTALPHLETGEGVTCASGVCAVPPGACASGYAHCTLDPADGCETDVSVPEHCGACDNSCGAGAPFCALGKCSVTCPKEAPTECGKSCADLMTDPMHCGDCAKACAQPQGGGKATCVAGQCGTQCFDGHHACADGTCASNVDKNHCEASCKACSGTANGEGQCVNNSCTIACNSGYHSCTASGTCAADNDKTQCTASCMACPPVKNGTVACAGNACVTQSCANSYHKCPDGSCASDDSATGATCTDSCITCPTEPNAKPPTCVANACITECKPGFKLCSDKKTCVDPSVDPTCGGPLLAVGGQYACAIRSGGTVWCWSARTLTPTQVSGLTKVVQISFSSGGADVCGVKEDGSIWCWGLSPATVPTDVSQQMKFLQVAGGGTQPCAISTANKVFCLNGTWQPKGTFAATHLATFEGTGYARASDGSIWSWAYGAMPAKQSAPVGPFAQVEIEYGVAAYRTTTGAVVYVGSAGDTQLNGPIDVGELSGATTFTQVSAGLRGGCALASDGRVGCWGYGPYGQLGNGATANSTAMVRFGGSGFIGAEVARGQLWTCALKDDHTVWCAGEATPKSDGTAQLVGVITVP